MKTAKDGKWYRFPKRGLRVICCDCGSQHVAEFKQENAKIYYRAFKIIK